MKPVDPTAGAAPIPPACLPAPAGLPSPARCLCIGLDIAWHGGSQGKPDTQYDCLVFAATDPHSADAPALHCESIKLTARDPDAEQIFAALRTVIERHGTGRHIVLAIDAPMQGTRTPPHGRKMRRACEAALSIGRQAIDRAMGGAKQWHPNIQPGLPLACRVQKLLRLLERELHMHIWTPAHAAHPRLIIECFPAEAIWAARRLGGYPAHTHGTTLRAYKRQQGRHLTAGEIETLVADVLRDAFAPHTGLPDHWPAMVRALTTLMLQREGWRRGGKYRGGKFLDDAVDSAICLATALSYAIGTAHVWRDPAHPGDGHIIGPGEMHHFLAIPTAPL